MSVKACVCAMRSLTWCMKQGPRTTTCVDVQCLFKGPWYEALVGVLGDHPKGAVASHPSWALCCIGRWHRHYESHAVPFHADRITRGQAAATHPQVMRCQTGRGTLLTPWDHATTSFDACRQSVSISGVESRGEEARARCDDECQCCAGWTLAAQPCPVACRAATASTMMALDIDPFSRACSALRFARR